MKDIKKVVVSEQPVTKKSLDETVEKMKKEEANKKDVPPKDPATKENSDDGEDEDKEIELRRPSYVMLDGSLIEMLYDGDKRTTKLAVYKDGKVRLEDSVQIDDKTVFMPLSPNQSLLQNRYVLFPSEVGKYQSNEALYAEVRAFVDKYVLLQNELLSVVAVYIMTTWVYDRFRTFPYLRVKGTYGSGKSRLLVVAGNLSYKAVMAGGSISNAALFRTLDLLNPTLVFDEAELSEKESTEMRTVLRQGYSDGTPVSRMDPRPDGNMYIKTFNVFCPKIIASMVPFQDAALESRCLTGWMPPHRDSERPIELSDGFKKDALALRNKLLMFRFQTRHLVTADESALDGIKLPRLKQTGLPVMSVAKMLGLQPAEDVRKFLEEYELELGMDQADSVENDVLLCILELLTESRIKRDGKIRTGSDLTEKFNLRHYEEYSTRETKTYDSHSQGVMKFPGQKVSPKKIGVYVRKMGFRFDRDSRGFYISVPKEYQKICILAKRYGLDTLYVLPETNYQGVKKLEEKHVNSESEDESNEFKKKVASVDTEEDDGDWGTDESKDTPPPTGS